MERVEPSPYSRHLPSLDGIRGLAAIGVVLVHVFPGNTHNALESGVAALFHFGSTGVDLFFVLSGFLITGILYDSLGEPRYFRKFYARRALRIFPLYYGVVLVCAVCCLYSYGRLILQLGSVALYLHNTYLLAPPIWVPTNRVMLGLGHFWSLAVEEQFYLVWPLVVFSVRRRKALLWICAAVLIACPMLRLAMFHAGFSDASIHASTLARADSLLTGAALALLLRGPKHDRVLHYAPPLLVIMLPAGAALMWLADRFAHGFENAAVPFGFQYTALELAAAALICCSLRPGVVATVFHWRVLRWIGKYSYGIYVYHLIVFTALEYPLRKWLIEHVSSSKGVLVFGVGGISLLVAVLLAYTSFQVYERRFLRLKRFFDYRPHPDTVVPDSPDGAGLSGV